MRYLKQRFEARQYPSAIFFAPASDEGEGDVVVGPFCVHCGNPLSLHSPKARCPNVKLHPAFPNGTLPTREKNLRSVRSRRPARS